MEAKAVNSQHNKRILWCYGLARLAVAVGNVYFLIGERVLAANLPAVKRDDDMSEIRF